MALSVEMGGEGANSRAHPESLPVRGEEPHLAVQHVVDGTIDWDREVPEPEAGIEHAPPARLKTVGASWGSPSCASLPERPDAIEHARMEPNRRAGDALRAASSSWTRMADTLQLQSVSVRLGWSHGN